MQYRKMPKSDDRISILGLGLMRLPTSQDGKINEELTVEMLDHALSSGVNYLDTAWPYHGGESEPFFGRWLERQNRLKVLLATKMPCWLIKTPDDLPKYFDEQLARLRTDYVDYYLLHSLGNGSWAAMRKFKALDFLERMKAEGRIRHIGFSFHDKYPVFKKIALAYDWDFTQIMFNYFDTRHQAGLSGFRLAIERGMGVIAMEPLRGGKLVQQVPPEVSRIWTKSNHLWTPVERALNWIWHHGDCTVALSGMSSLAQLQENLRLADAARADILDDRELELYNKARLAYLKRIAIRCSECRYCLPCPHNVAIPTAFGIYNEAMMFDTKERHTAEYKIWLSPESRAGKCTQCGACVPKCPQHIDIPRRLSEVAEFFGE